MWEEGKKSQRTLAAGVLGSAPPGEEAYKVQIKQTS